MMRIYNLLDDLILYDVHSYCFQTVLTLFNLSNRKPPHAVGIGNVFSSLIHSVSSSLYFDRGTKWIGRLWEELQPRDGRRTEV